MPRANSRAPTLTCRRLLLAAALFAALWVAAMADAKPPSVEQHSFEFNGIRRAYYGFAPPADSEDPPLLIVLHGSYGSARQMLNAWTALASEEGLLLLAPQARDRKVWSIRADGPAFIRALVDEVQRRHPLDRERIYLFGYSGGAVYALTLSMIESEYFAAVAVYGGVWRASNEFAALRYARRKVPIAIFMGERDEFFPSFAVRNTQRALEEAGHEVNLTILGYVAHDYGQVAEKVNRDAWNFLKRRRLNSSRRGL
ncbi:MAG TPA: dienelactone hydrolase family protein [Steroidobacter sp.]|nr:dienelactone hydrolase family protein [Steroidobacter sp.]